MSDTDLKVPVKGSLLDKENYKKSYQKAYKKKHKEVTKSLQIQIRSSEYERLKSVAKSEKLPVSKYVYNTFLVAEKRVQKRSGIYREIATELSRIGNNINQIAHQLNSKNKLFVRNPKDKFQEFVDQICNLNDKIDNLKY